jgi:hypothetical protein
VPRYTRVDVPAELTDGSGTTRFVVDTEHPSGNPTAIAKAANPYTGGNPIDDITAAMNAVDEGP